jgi:hypothetical protein
MSPADGIADAAGIVGRCRIAMLAPCYNEETAIGKVVANVRAALPEAGMKRLVCLAQRGPAEERGRGGQL